MIGVMNSLGPLENSKNRPEGSLSGRSTLVVPARHDDKKLRLLVAAESLFAERPIESVSLREIAVKAGNGNNNAVQYHFGGKQGLIQALFAWRVAQMEAPRAAIYAAIRAEGREPDLPDLVRILCLPLLDLVDDEGRHSYAAFIAQYLLRHRPTGLTHTADLMIEENRVLRILLRDIHEACGLSQSGGGDYRTGLTQLIFCNMLVLSDTERLQERDPEAFAQRVNSALSMATNALACLKSS
jgi:TetR/AcrR family transcriptional regulator, regulator of cefoperazone and chloramphenicol sensitivity